MTLAIATSKEKTNLTHDLKNFINYKESYKKCEENFISCLDIKLTMIYFSVLIYSLYTK